MDISALKPSERIVEIKSPVDGEPLGIRVGLLSINDDRLTALKRKFQDKRIRLEQRGKGFNAEQLDENKRELAFAAMTSWEWYAQPEEKDKATGAVIKPAREKPSFKGKVPSFDKANVFAVFIELYWFHDQIMSEIGEEQSFFGN